MIKFSWVNSGASLTILHAEYARYYAKELHELIQQYGTPDSIEIL